MTMHDITIRLYRALTAITSVLVLLGIPAMATGLERVPLPPGYTYPEIPHVDIPDPLFDPPQKGCHGCGGGDGIRLYYEDYAGWRKPLDRYGHKNSTWELLTFEHGFKQAWLGPQFAARLYHHSTDSVRFITRERLVVFEKRTDDNGDISLECVSDDNWSLRRDGDRVIVESPLRWWAFESPDYGQEWRLVETCMHTFPFPAKLHYDGPHPMLPSALEYPDGKTATIEPAPGTEMVGKITLPNGIVYKIGYDANNFAEFLEEYVPTTEAPKQELENFTIVNQGGEIKQSVTWKKPKTYLKLIHRWAWENDDLGRIHRMINPCGRETKLTFAQHTSDRGDEILTIMTDVTTGNYDYMRHIAKGGVWTIERGHGIQNQPIEKATFGSSRVKKSIANGMRNVAYTSGETGHTTYTEHDPQGEPISRKEVDANGKVLWERSLQPKRLADYSQDQYPTNENACKPDCATYTYKNGLLFTATHRGKIHTFAFDDLGRMQGNKVGDQQLAWTYTLRNQLESQQDLEQLTTWTYYPDRRLKSRQNDQRPPTVYRYSCEGLRERIVGHYQIHGYRYNDQRRLRRHAITPHPNAKYPTIPQVDYYRYRDQGQLDAMKRMISNSDPILITYRYDDETGARHADQIAGPVTDPMLTHVKTEISIDNGQSISYAAYNTLGTVVLQEPNPPDTEIIIRSNNP